MVRLGSSWGLVRPGSELDIKNKVSFVETLQGARGTANGPVFGKSSSTLSGKLEIHMIDSTTRRVRETHSVSAILALPLAALFSILPATSLAVGLAVVNPGFEDIGGETVVNEFTFGPLSGWGLYEDPPSHVAGGTGPTYFLGTLTPFEQDPIGNPGVFVNFPAGALEGQRVGIAFNFFGSGGEGEWGFVQLLADTLQPNTQYTLEVGIGNIASGTSMSGQDFPLDGFPGYRVDLLAGGVAVASDNNSLAGTIPEGEFRLSTVSLTTDDSHPQLGATLAIRLVSLNAVDPAFPASDLEVDFDDVRLDATPVIAVPTLHMPLLGILALALLVSGGRRLQLHRVS